MHTAIHTSTHHAYLTREVLILELGGIDAKLAEMREECFDREQLLSALASELPSVINWAEGCLANIYDCVTTTHTTMFDVVTLCIDSVCYILSEYQKQLIAIGNVVVQHRASIESLSALRKSKIQMNDRTIDSLFSR